MRNLDFITADVFTGQVFGGNPLAVFPDAAGLDDGTMQRIAKELNLSETVFVMPPADAANTRRVRIFTPAVELPFAGHPTVGTAIVLAEIGALSGIAPWNIVLEEGVGPIPVVILNGPDGRLFAALSSARMPALVDEPPSRPVLSQLLGLPESAVTIPGVPPAAYSAGVPFTIVPVTTRSALSAIRLDTEVWQKQVAGTKAPHIFAVFMEDWQKGETVHTRMFAPAMGIQEDPATGAAATALAGYLVHSQNIMDGHATWKIVQGEDMGRPSLIHLNVRVEAGQLQEVRVGGGAVMVSRGTFHVPG
ncbi:PhzF family phenazine biosynthesis protein [Azospirillum endophyticum]